MATRVKADTVDKTHRYQRHANENSAKRIAVKSVTENNRKTIVRGKMQKTVTDSENNRTIIVKNSALSNTPTSPSVSGLTADNRHVILATVASDHLFVSLARTVQMLPKKLCNEHTCDEDLHLHVLVISGDESWVYARARFSWQYI